jgi:hypothetical protein
VGQYRLATALQRKAFTLKGRAQAAVGYRTLQSRAGEPQPRLHGAKRNVELLRNGAVRQTFEDHQRKLLLRQDTQRVAHIFLPLHCVDMFVAAVAGIGNGEKIFGRKAAFAAAARQAKSTIFPQRAQKISERYSSSVGS